MKMQLPRSVQAGAEVIRFALAAELGGNGRIVLFLPVSLAICAVQWYADNSIVGLSTAACFGTLYRSKIQEEGCIMKKLLALLMAVAVTFQLVTPVFADTEGTEETTAPTEAVVETKAPTEAPAEETTAPTEETTAPTEETTAPTEETSAPTEETEEATEATEETVEDIALFADDGDVIASGECGINVT